MYVSSNEVKILLSSSVIAIALVAFSYQNKQQEMAEITLNGLPPFANPYFDVSLNTTIVTIPEDGGSVGLLVTLNATELNSSDILVLETNSDIPKYTAAFKPTSVTLKPGDSISLKLTVVIPSGVKNGIYPMSIVARGNNTQSGNWLIIIIGPTQPTPPP